MEIKKIKTRSRTVDFSARVDSNPSMQKQYLQFVFKDYINGMYELGWEISVVQNGFILARLVSTDAYEITDIENDATNEQLLRLVYETYEQAKNHYNEEKTFLPIAEQLSAKPDGDIDEILQELTRILKTLH